MPASRPPKITTEITKGLDELQEAYLLDVNIIYAHAETFDHATALPARRIDINSREC